MPKEGYLEFACPHCGRQSSIKESLQPLGKKKQCRGCGQTFVIGGAAATSAPASSHNLQVKPPTNREPLGFLDESSESPLEVVASVPPPTSKANGMVVPAPRPNTSSLAFLEQEPAVGQLAGAPQKTEVMPQFSPQMLGIGTSGNASTTPAAEDNPNKFLPLLFLLIVATIVGGVYYVRVKKQAKMAAQERRAEEARRAQQRNNSAPVVQPVVDSEEQAFKEIGHLAEKSAGDRYRKWQALQQFITSYPQGRFTTKAEENSEILRQNLLQMANQWCQDIDMALAKNDCIQAWDKHHCFPPELLQLADVVGEKFEKKLARLQQQVIDTVVKTINREAEALRTAIDSQQDAPPRISQQWQQESRTVWLEWLEKWPQVKTACDKIQAVETEWQQYLAQKQERARQQEDLRRQKIAETETRLQEFTASYARKMKARDYKGAGQEFETFSRQLEELMKATGDDSASEWLLAWQQEQQCLQKIFASVQQKADRLKGHARSFRINGREVKGAFHHYQQGKVYLQAGLAVIGYPLQHFSAEDLHSLTAYSQEPEVNYVVALTFFYENNSEKANQHFALVKAPRLQFLIRKFYPAISWVHDKNAGQHKKNR